jgi:hypothetical protein
MVFEAFVEQRLVARAHGCLSAKHILISKTEVELKWTIVRPSFELMCDFDLRAALDFLASSLVPYISHSLLHFIGRPPVTGGLSL